MPDRRNRVDRTGKNSKHKKRRYNAGLIAVVCLAAVAVFAVVWLVASNTQNLSNAKVTTSSYTADGTTAAVQYRETQKFYSIDVRRPDYTQNPISQTVINVYENSENLFRSYLGYMLADKVLSKDDPAKLTLDFNAVSFNGYVTYTITSEIYCSADNENNQKQTVRIITETDTLNELAPADLFVAGYDYNSALCSKAAAELGIDSALLKAETDLFTDALTLTPTGLLITFDDAIGDAVAANTTVLLDYTPMYSSYAIDIPADFKPADPTPIDPEAEKVIALTFDDGPHGVHTRSVLNVLDKYNAKATFFVVGYNVEYHPDLIREIVERGHEIAIHSTEHKNLLKMTESAALADINGLGELIGETCGVNPYLMRPMGGYMNQALADTLARPVILWDIDTRDWESRNADSVYNKVIGKVKSGDIVLAHDIYKSTADAFERIIPKLIEEGYRLVTVSELLGIQGMEETTAYAGKIITYRVLSKELRAAGQFDTLN